VPSFRTIGVLLFGGFLWCQPVQVVTDNGHKMTVNPSNVEQVLNQLLQTSGDLGGSYHLTGNQEGHHPRVDYHYSSNPLQVDSLVFRKAGPLQAAVAYSVFKPLLGSRPATGTRYRLRQIQSAFSFLTFPTAVDFARYQEDKIAVLVDFQPEFKSYVSGSLGTNRDQTADRWETTGEFHLHLENPFGAATTTEVEWRQPSRESRNLHFYLDIPFLPTVAFGIRSDFSQQFRSNLFMNKSFSLAATGLSSWGYWRLGLKTGSTLPLDQNLDESLSGIQTRELEAGIRGDRRQRRWLPVEGTYWDVGLGVGQTRTNKQNYPTFSFLIQSGHYLALKNQVLFLKLWGEGRWIQNSKLHRGQQVRFGGVNSLLGYREEQFSADWVMIPTLEWIPVHTGEGQMFTFINGAIFKTNVFPVGYGLGFRQFKRGILLELLLGLSEGNTLSEGKIHIRISTAL